MNFENDAALGLSATETTRNAAANEAFGKSFKDLSEGQKQLTLLKMVEDANKVSGAMGMAAKESDGLENVIGNLSQTWTDLKAAVGQPIMDKAIEEMINLTHWMGRIDGQKIADNLMAGAAYLNETFSPLLGVVKEDLQKLWGVMNGEGGASALQTAFDSLQTGMQWIADHWQGIKDAVVAMTAAFVTYNAVLGGAMILQTINKLMILYHSGLLITTAQQWLLNAAMAANPIGLVAAAIAGLVGVGILLYKNWDTVREKTDQLWFKLGEFKGVATVVLGPIGLIIRAAVTMADQWDSTKGVWENVWNGIKVAAENSVNDVIGSLNLLIETINRIPGVNIPIIPKVDWTPLERVTSGGLDGGGLGVNVGMGAQSHATGLERVPYDNYLANLHAGESVLTAKQSNTLRSMGVLKANGDKPVLDGSALAGRRTNTGRKLGGTATASVSIGAINVNGHNKPTKDIAREILTELQSRIAGGVLA